MDLLPKSIWIFVIAVLSIIMTGLFPSPSMIMLTSLLTSFLVILQVLIILKDKAEGVEDTPNS